MRFFPNFQQPSRLFALALPAIAAISLVLAAQPSILKAQDRDDRATKPTRTLTLSATGTIKTRPDMASINTGIQTEAVKARDALDDNSDIMARMMKSLKAAGLEDRDIATTQFSVQPRYQHFKNGRPRKIIGYRVVNSLSITTPDIEDLGAILDRLVSLGSNRIGGIQFGLKDPEKTLDEARKKAMQKVLDKAALYARAADVELGSILSISEQTSRHFPQPMKMRSMRASAPVPLAPGQHTTSVTVHVKWALVE